MSVEVPYETNLYYIYDRVKVDLLSLWILLLYSRALLIVMNTNYLMFNLFILIKFKSKESEILL